MAKRVLLSCIFIVLLLTVGCSSKVDNPEDTLGQYIKYWTDGNYNEMMSVLTEDSFHLTEQLASPFVDRYEKVYADLDVEILRAEFEPKDFKKENIDLKSITEITYPVTVKMDTMAGELEYITEITLEIEKDSDDEEAWKIRWHPTHLFAGLENPTDKIIPQTLHPKRGEIYDRNGKGLAINGEVYEISIVPDRTENLEETAKQLAEKLGLDVESVLSRAERYLPERPDWATLIQKMPLNDPRKDSILKIPGVLMGKDDGRIYPYGDITGHLVGHIGLITAEELEQNQGRGYNATSMIGKNNLELVFEDSLRGSRGGIISVSNSNNQNTRVVGRKEAIDGENIYLTIDIDIQEKLVKAISGEQGSAIAMDPKKGEVLALVSEPAFDSNLRYLGLRDPRAAELDVNTLFERRYQFRYSPGSIFKPFTAIMGIEEKTLNPEEKLNIDGRRWQYSAAWGGYNVTRVNDDNLVDLNVAMKRSDNIYFAQQSLNLGRQKFEDWSAKFGFGEVIPFEFPLLESTLSNNGLNRDILLADTGYGQGEIQISPVHITTMYTIFLNEGSLIQPRLLKGQSAEYYRENISSKETVSKVLETLKLVVENPKGTAYRTNPGHNRMLAGKTGTAELKGSIDEEDGKQLGWYVSFDYYREDLLVTIMLENVEGRGGSSLAVNAANRFWGTIDN